MSDRIQLQKNFSISRVIAGMMNLSSWSISTQELIDFLHQLQNMGVSTVDHADIYGSYTCEAIFGQALKQEPTLRSNIELISKCGIALLSENRPKHFIKHYNTSEYHIISSTEQSLRNLNTDYLDLLLIHRPDPLMDYDGISAAFDKLHQQGKVKYFGVSNFTPEQIRTLKAFSDQPIVTNQIQLSAVHVESFHNGDLDFLQAEKIIPTAWSPLGGGQLFGGGGDEAIQRLRKVIKALSEKYQAGMDQVMLAWLLMHPANICPVLGTGKISRIEAAVQAEKIRLSRQEWFEVYTATLGRRVA